MATSRKARGRGSPGNGPRGRNGESDRPPSRLSRAQRIEQVARAAMREHHIQTKVDPELLQRAGATRVTPNLVQIQFTPHVSALYTNEGALHSIGVSGVWHKLLP